MRHLETHPCIVFYFIVDMYQSVLSLSYNPPYAAILWQNWTLKTFTWNDMYIAFPIYIFFLGTFGNLSSPVTLITLQPLNGILLNLILESFILNFVCVFQLKSDENEGHFYMKTSVRFSASPETVSLMLLARKKYFRWNFWRKMKLVFQARPHFPARFAVLRDVRFKTVLLLSEHISFCGGGYRTIFATYAI